MIRADKCHTFGIMKKNTTSKQTKTKLYVNNELMRHLKHDEALKI